MKSKTVGVEIAFMVLVIAVLLPRLSEPEAMGPLDCEITFLVRDLFSM
jgi:hypothetical protein